MNDEEKLYTIIEQKSAWGSITGEVQISVRAKDIKDALDKMQKLIL